MEEKIRREKLKTELVTMVRSKCPFMHGLYNDMFEFDKRCKNCEFLANGTIEISPTLRMKTYDKRLTVENYCSWKEYEAELVKKFSESDDDELYGGMPSDTYYKVINCYRCGEHIVYTSGMSSFMHGDVLECKSCKLKHRYIGYKNQEKHFASGKYVFAIPVGIKKLR
jgi:hypothetical protein